MNINLFESLSHHRLDMFVRNCVAYQESTTAENLSKLRNKNKDTLLHAAIQEKAHAAAIWLITKWADVNTRGAQNYTPLHLAAVSGNYTLTTILLNEGADPNAEECDGQTALHKAVFSRNADVVKAIIDAGANINQADDYGYTPLDLLFENMALAKLLKDHGAFIGQPRKNAREVAAVAVTEVQCECVLCGVTYHISYLTDGLCPHCIKQVPPEEEPTPSDSELTAALEETGGSDDCKRK